MNPRLTELSTISDILYNNDAYYGEIFNMSRALKSLLQTASGTNHDNALNDDTIYTSSGKAIGPKFAGRCVDDIMRTKRFGNAVYKAVVKVKAKKKRKVHILYAGTGPFAALIIPLITRFSPSEISFTLLDINPVSFEGVKKTIAYFGAEEYIEDMVLCDATEYKIPEDRTVDIVVSETMMRGLKDEHQVAISHKLISQIDDDVILIPEEISLNLLAINLDKQDISKKQMNTSDLSYFDNLGNLFKLNIASIRNHQDAFLDSFPNYQFPETSITIPDNTNLAFHVLSIETHIKVFDDEVLKIDESGLTVLVKLIELNPMMQTARKVHAKYVCGTHPGLQCRMEN